MLFCAKSAIPIASRACAYNKADLYHASYRYMQMMNFRSYCTPREILPEVVVKNCPLLSAYFNVP